MVCSENAESPSKEPIKPCSIKLFRDRDIDQRLRKKCKKNNEAGIQALSVLILNVTSSVNCSKNKTPL